MNTLDATPHKAYVMLEALNDIYPITEPHKQFIVRIINTAYQEGKLDGFRQVMGDNTQHYE